MIVIYGYELADVEDVEEMMEELASDGDTFCDADEYTCNWVAPTSWDEFAQFFEVEIGEETSQEEFFAFCDKMEEDNVPFPVVDTYDVVAEDMRTYKRLIAF